MALTLGPFAGLAPLGARLRAALRPAPRPRILAHAVATAGTPGVHLTECVPTMRSALIFTLGRSAVEPPPLLARLLLRPHPKLSGVRPSEKQGHVVGQYQRIRDEGPIPKTEVGRVPTPSQGGGKISKSKLAGWVPTPCQGVVIISKSKLAGWVPTPCQGVVIISKPKLPVPLVTPSHHWANISRSKLPEWVLRSRPARR
mmetsp:Transcript_99961/g.229429  ORF Transcript_99961/g.229429 Transcript_99961/m.229429 type:complete len:200 (+) Transcript_99961:655-1254(+)